MDDSFLNFNQHNSQPYYKTRDTYYVTIHILYYNIVHRFRQKFFQIDYLISRPTGFEKLNNH